MAKDSKEYGFEGGMAMSQLKGIMQHAKQLHDMLKPETDLPEWVQSKITLAYDYMQTATDYMSTEMNEEAEHINEVSLEKLLAYRKKSDKYREQNWNSKDPAVKKKFNRRANFMDVADDKIKKKTGTDEPSVGQRIKAKITNEEAAANSIGAGKIAGMGVGAQGEPGRGPKAMKKYRDKNAAGAPKVGRKTFTMFMQGK